MGEIQLGESSNDPTLVNTVDILLKAIGPSRPSHLNVPSCIKVRDLRKLVAESKQLPIETLRLISRGSALHDSKNGEDVSIKLSDGGKIIGFLSIFLIFSLIFVS
ncbi:unnamed protein product [Amaranthus hypochondriacus]